MDQILRLQIGGTHFQMAVEKGYMAVATLIYASNPVVYEERWLWVDAASRYTKDQNMIDWLQEITSAPATLRLFCRRKLRLVLGYDIEQKVQQLEYPEILKNYLLLCDIL